MPSVNKTANIGLNQWQGNEYPKRQDFVDDNIKVDTEIGNLKNDFLSYKNDEMTPSYDTPRTTTSEVTSLNTLNKNLVSLVITGKTIVNLLGVAGDCEDVSLWTDFQSTHSLDNSNKVIGNNGLKIAIATGYTAGHIYRTIGNVLDNSKYYGVAAYVKNGNATNVSLLCWNDGSGVSSSMITDTTKFNRVWLKLKPSDIKVNSEVDINVNGAAGQYAYVDGIMLEEISAADYNNPAWTPSAYVTNDTSVGDTPTSIKGIGRNLIDVVQGYYANWNIPDSTPQAIRHKDVLINVKPNTTYSVSISSPLNYIVHEWDVNRARLFYLAKWSTSPVTSYTITTDVNTKYISVAFKLDGTTPIYPENYKIMLNEGDIALPYEPYQKTVMPIPYPLRILPSGIADIQDTKKGKVIKKVERVITDGSLNWVYGTSGTGYKVVKNLLFTNEKQFASDIGVLYKYNNKKLPFISGASLSSGDQCQMNNDGNLYISIPASESGWGDSYTNVTADEIKAQRFGWKMYDSNTYTNVTALSTNGATYNGTGAKCWVSLNGGSGTTTLPTTLAPGFTPDRLYYQLAQPQEIDINIPSLVAFPNGNLTMESDSQSWVRPAKVEYTMCENSRANLEEVMKQVSDSLSRNSKTALQIPLTKEKFDYIGMINELFINADNGQRSIANVVGSPTVVGDTYTKIANDIQGLKNSLATHLTNKGQPSSGNETLNNLVNKVQNVTTGARRATGTTVSSSALVQGFQYAGSTSTIARNTLTVTGLDFKPTYIIAKWYDTANFRDNVVIYEELPSGIYPKTVKSSIYYQADLNNTTYNLKGDVGPANVYNGGFVIPVSSGSTSYSWRAYE